MKGVQKHSVLSLPLFCKSTVVLKNYTKSFMAPPPLGCSRGDPGVLRGTKGSPAEVKAQNRGLGIRGKQNKKSYV